MNTKELIKIVFQAKIVPIYQVNIVEAILYKKYEHTLIMASRQSGKSYGVAKGITLLARFGKNEKILLIAPTQKQARVIYDYVLEFSKKSPLIYAALEMKRTRDIQNLGDEMSKSEITFTIKDKEGNIEYKNTLTIMTAGTNAKKNTLLGQSPTTIVIDETQGVNDEIYYNVIMPMMATIKETKYTLIELGTPHVRNHFYKSWVVSKANKIKITCWDAIEEGIQRREFIEDQQEQLSPDEFAVWYEASFPDSDSDSLYTFKEVENAKRKKEIPKTAIKLLGSDIARYGNDLTVLYDIYIDEDEDELFFGDRTVLKKKGTDITAGTIKAQDRISPYYNIMVDDIGVGGGVTDQLKDLNKVVAVNFGSTKMKRKDKERFLNIKARLYYRLKEYLQKDKTYNLDDSKLEEELLLMKKEHQSNGKLKIIDPSKSPDYADSVVIALAKRKAPGLHTGSAKTWT